MQAGIEPARELDSGVFEDLLDAAEGTQHTGRFVGHENRLGVLAIGHFAEAFNVAHRDEVVGRIDLARLKCLGDDENRIGLGLGHPLQRFRLPLGTKHGGLFFTFGTIDIGLTAAFCFQDLGGFGSLGGQDLGALLGSLLR